MFTTSSFQVYIILIKLKITARILHKIHIIFNSNLLILVSESIPFHLWAFISEVQSSVSDYFLTFFQCHNHTSDLDFSVYDYSLLDFVDDSD